MDRRSCPFWFRLPRPAWFNSAGTLNASTQVAKPSATLRHGHADANWFTECQRRPHQRAGVGAGQLLGTSLTLDGTKGLVVGQTTTVNNSGSLTLAGGSLSTSNLVVDGSIDSASFTMTGGTLTASTMHGQRRRRRRFRRPTADDPR